MPPFLAPGIVFVVEGTQLLFTPVPVVWIVVVAMMFAHALRHPVAAVFATALSGSLSITTLAGAALPVATLTKTALATLTALSIATLSLTIAASTLAPAALA